MAIGIVNMFNQGDTRAEIRAWISELEKAQRSLEGVLLPQGYIVECEGLYLSFDVDEDGRVENPRPSAPHQCRRFGRQEAEAFASNIRNGNGTTGTAVHVVDAIALQLSILRELLAELDSGIGALKTRH